MLVGTKLLYMQEVPTMNLEQHFCPHKDCSNAGQPGKGNIKPVRQYGQQKTWLLRCTTCRGTFAETRDTIFFRRRTSRQKIVSALLSLVERSGIRGAARKEAIDKDTLCDWLKDAARHAEALRRFLLHDVHLAQAQVDEIFTFVYKKQKKVQPTDSPTVGEVMIFRGIKVESRLRLASHVGKRTEEETSKFIGKAKEITDGKAPFWCSDGFDYGQALREHYSTVVPEEGGKRKPGRPRKHPKRQVDPELKYAQVVKGYDGQGHLVEIKRTMIIGSATEALQMLNDAGTGKVFNTSYIERDNLTSRTHNGRLVRRSLTFSKAVEPLQGQCQLDDLYYNFCLPHQALRQKLTEPQATKGEGSPKKYHQRTPAMAEGLTDRRWTMLELMSFRVPPIRAP
jgi:hypothetical protein